MRYSTIDHNKLSSTACDAIIIPVVNKQFPHADLRALDKSHQGLLKKAIQSGGLGEHLGDSLMFPSTTKQSPSVLFIQCGHEKNMTRQQYQIINKALLHELKKTHFQHVINTLPLLEIATCDYFWRLRDIMYQVTLAYYQFDELKTSEKIKYALKKMSFLTLDAQTQKQAKLAIKQGSVLEHAIHTACYLGDMPGNLCTPPYLAQYAKKMAGSYQNLSVRVLGEKDIQKLGMGALYSVAQGSKLPAQFIILNYQGASRKTQAPIVLVGKGITFDTGGISLKTTKGMQDMKYDMLGSASVIATLQACAEYQVKQNVIGLVPAAENFPAHTATKPTDVVTSMSGLTIEITNTDAEGRLVLCDALTYAKRFKPKAVIDIATLTGAVSIALGKTYSGLFGNDDTLIQDLLTSGKRTQDLAWQLPIHEDYHKMLQSDVADIVNSHKQAPLAASSFAATFLSRFAEDYRWAHMDIAGSSWTDGRKCNGRPIGLLFDYILQA